VVVELATFLAQRHLTLMTFDNQKFAHCTVLVL
jgi:hypothetical protein